MSERRTTRPKVFISYAWGKNKSFAKELADRLCADGIEVVLDVYDLQEGHNKHAFMQRTVNDASIEHVLVLCDADYQQKADGFSGGVGEEATIITSEIYGRVEQTKFLPILLEKNAEGKPCLPTLFASILYFDFSDPEYQSEEYRKLVRRLWGEPDMRKPMVGERPKWLDAETANTVGLESLLTVQATLVRKAPSAVGLVGRATQEFVAALNMLSSRNDESFDLIAAISQTEPVRNCFLRFVENILLQEDVDGDAIGSVIEKMYKGVHVCNNRDGWEEGYLFFFWDIFICATAYLLEYERFADLHMLVNRTYFLRNLIGSNNDPKPYTFSQFRQYLQLLEGSYKSKIAPNRVSLAADLLVGRTYGTVVTKRNLAVADLTLAHLAMIYGQSESGFSWYAALAPYTDCAGCGLVWERLPSRRFCEKLLPLFGVQSIPDLKEVVGRMSDEWNEHGRRGYQNACWGVAGVLSRGGIDRIASMP